MNCPRRCSSGTSVVMAFTQYSDREFFNFWSPFPGIAADTNAARMNLTRSNETMRSLQTFDATRRTTIPLSACPEAARFSLTEIRLLVKTHHWRLRSKRGSSALPAAQHIKHRPERSQNESKPATRANSHLKAVRAVPTANPEHSQDQPKSREGHLQQNISAEVALVFQ